MLTRSYAVGASMGADDVSRSFPGAFACDLTELDGSGWGVIISHGGGGNSLYAGFSNGGRFRVRVGSGGIILPAPPDSSVLYCDTEPEDAPKGDGTLVISADSGSSLRVWWNGTPIPTIQGYYTGGTWAGTAGGGYLKAKTDTGGDEWDYSPTYATASELRVYELQSAAS